jgi:hypothetical protein
MSAADRIAIVIAQQVDQLIAKISLAEDVTDVFGLARRADEIIAELPEHWDREILLERLDDAIGERMQREESP